MIECVRYSPVNKSTCLGVATIFVPKWGVEISGISLHQKDGKRWVNLPARIVEEGPEKKYYPYIRFREKEHKERFCDMIKKAIDANAAEKDILPEQNNDEEIPF